MAELRDLPGFGRLVDGLIWVISGFGTPDRAFAIAFIIVLVAVVIWGVLHFKYHRPWVQPIRRVSAKLRKLIKETSDASKRLVDADEIFRLEQTIEPLWREYRKQFKADSKTGGYLNLVDPRIWFSAESLPGRGYEHWCATWAGVFLTVGLLFTFIGLSAALLKVADIGAADSAAMKAAITGILGVSSAKFITSIAGLLAYIGFSLVTRRYQSSQQSAARELADAVQHLSLPLTPELLLYEQNKTAQKQLERMERFTDDLAVAIDGKLEKRLQILASDFGQQLGTIQQNLPGATAEPIVDAIQNMARTVTAGGEINAVAERLSAVAEQLATLKDGMGGVGNQFGTDIKTASDALIAAAQKMGEGVDGRSSELEEKIGQFSSKLDQIAATLAQVPGNIDTALNETLRKLTESIGGIATTVGQVPAKIDMALNDTLSKLTNAIDALVQQISEGGRSGATALSVGGEEAGQTLKTSAGEAGRELKGKIDEVANTLAQIPNSIDRALKETLKGFNQSSADGGNALREGGQQAGNEIRQATGQLEVAIKDLATRLLAIESSLQSLPDVVAAQVQNLTNAGRAFETAGQTVVNSGTALRQASEIGRASCRERV